MASILVIDDDEQTRAFLRRVLAEAGYMVMEAPHKGQGPKESGDLSSNTRTHCGNLLIGASLASSVLPADFSGTVVSVLDGNTLEVLHNHHAERIRLSGIDCPEKGQAFGNKAKHAASELVFGKEVTLQTHGKDKYRRTLGDVFLPDGTNVNHALVKEGWCWWYRKYAPGSTTLERLEVEAREVRIPGVLRKARVPTRWDAT